MTQYVFVYGTLKKAYWNHRLLAGRAKFLGDTTITGKLYNFGLPGYVMGDEGTVHGELYSFDDPTVLKDLDRLEGYNEQNPGKSFYIRSVVSTKLDDKEINAFVYEINRPMKEGDLIPTGKW